MARIRITGRDRVAAALLLAGLLGALALAIVLIAGDLRAKEPPPGFVIRLFEGLCLPAALGETWAYQKGLIPKRQLEDERGFAWEFWVSTNGWALVTLLPTPDGTGQRCILGAGSTDPEEGA